eukprot:gnl/Dysnectes_brevis/3980_a5188_459.p1 GENE.gnl/Dysnectes_brevis/3980_a5188_459~~gnl/Dysnectes_brevis/3980_a5188_459.p1  ORF type:complete len:550 (-),score=206.29 gnl/Dysnectes_brevis/3980_a5188_459:42-1646(-)
MMHTKMSSAFEKAKVVETLDAEEDIPSLESFIERRDFVGAVTLLKFQKQNKTVEEGVDADLWLAYCYFHLAEYEKADIIYAELLETGTSTDPSNLRLFRAICLLYQGKYQEARTLSASLPQQPLRNRLSFHTCARLLDEEGLMLHHSRLRNVPADQLALAGVHYLRSHFEQALECYEEVSATQPDSPALLLYMAMCYYRLGQYDRCLPLLEGYMERAEESITSLNLLSCVHYQMGHPEKALEAIAHLEDYPELAKLPLVKHNKCVFEQLSAGSHVLPTLLGVIPEARINLVKLELDRGNHAEAWKLLSNFEPAVSLEYVVKAATAAHHGQDSGDLTVLRYAQAAFSTVGKSEADKDTILGRRSMASSFFLLGEFADACLYLESVSELLQESGSVDPQFCLNFGTALAASGRFQEALDQFLLCVDSPHFGSEHRAWLVRCLVRLGRATEAFEVYLKSDSGEEEPSGLLTLIAHECFGAGEWRLCAKASDILIKLGGPVGSEPHHAMLRAALAAMELEDRGVTVEPPSLASAEEQE